MVSTWSFVKFPIIPSSLPDHWMIRSCSLILCSTLDHPLLDDSRRTCLTKYGSTLGVKSRCSLRLILAPQIIFRLQESCLNVEKFGVFSQSTNDLERSVVGVRKIAVSQSKRNNINTQQIFVDLPISGESHIPDLWGKQLLYVFLHQAKRRAQLCTTTLDSGAASNISHLSPPLAIRRKSFAAFAEGEGKRKTPLPPRNSSFLT